MFGISELAIVLIIFIVIFSAKKLPDLARSLGKSARILKSEAKAMKSDQAPSTVEEASPPEASTTRIIKAAPGDATSAHYTVHPGDKAPRP